jgi:hypothetical protein
VAKEEEIRLIAYNIWEQEGCINGKDCEHWFRAEAVWEERHKPSRKNTTKELESPITSVLIIPQPNRIEAYCVKCRVKKEIKDAKAVTTKNGKPATQGVCPTCKTKMFRIGKS